MPWVELSDLLVPEWDSEVCGSEMGTSPVSQCQDLAVSKLHCKVAGIKMKCGYRDGEASNLLRKRRI